MLYINQIWCNLGMSWKREWIGNVVGKYPLMWNFSQHANTVRPPWKDVGPPRKLQQLWAFLWKAILWRKPYVYQEWIEYKYYIEFSIVILLWISCLTFITEMPVEHKIISYLVYCTFIFSFKNGKGFPAVFLFEFCDTKNLGFGINNYSQKFPS
jgi:hypothetical protein